jgi:hypothetical protein
MRFVDADDIIQKVGNFIRDNIRPDITMFTEIYTDKIDGKAVIKDIAFNRLVRLFG